MVQQSLGQLSTGIPGLDKVIRAVIPGDNIVWHVETIDQYRDFVLPYSRHALQSGRPLIYFRFGRHEPLLPENSGAQVVPLNPAEGFETFVSKVHEVIRAAGRGAYYVFDCLSVLAERWYSDQMLGNFFLLTCPYLFDMETVACFALYKNVHSFHATAPILHTTQIFFDVYRHGDRTYVYPLKVQQRYSSTMYMLHVREGDQFLPVTQSTTTSQILTSHPWARLESPNERLGIWHRTLREADDLLHRVGPHAPPPPEAHSLLQRLVRLMISREERISQMVLQYFSLAEMLEVARRTLGTGLIGGKAVGMLLARAILRRSDPAWDGILEPHDSFYIGSDVFYSFLVRNGIWSAAQNRRDSDALLADSQRARQRILVGAFPDYIEKEFTDMLDYFGQAPFIVCSSSLLEDNFGNAFAGKYESIFCVNQGPREKRLEDFKSAVRSIYASTMSEKALSYRRQRGLLDRDEQMALLIQRVSGALHHHLFLPHLAGVGFSYNPYVWSDAIDPRAGVLRLVFGLGTRAVDRRDDDYTRVVALNAPEKRPEAARDEARQFTQKGVDVLDLEANQLLTYDFAEIISQTDRLPLDLFASRDHELERRAAEQGLKNVCPWTLTFDRLLTKTSFITDMRRMLHTLHEAYDYPVDVEFTCNFTDENDYKINLLQCRPLQISGGGALIPDPPADLAERDLVFRCHGAVIGKSRLTQVDRLVYVAPAVYGQLPLKDRYTIARLIGKLLHVPPFCSSKTILLVGPGRWGTTTPSLGVPVSFSEINTASVLCEIVAMREGLVPDVSLGTHLFSDLVEMDILYVALFPERPTNRFNEGFLEALPNTLTQYLPEGVNWAHVLRVADLENQRVWLNANALTQNVVCYRQTPSP